MPHILLCNEKRQQGYLSLGSNLIRNMEGSIISGGTANNLIATAVGHRRCDYATNRNPRACKEKCVNDFSEFRSSAFFYNKWDSCQEVVLKEIIESGCEGLL